MKYYLCPFSETKKNLVYEHYVIGTSKQTWEQLLSGQLELYIHLLANWMNFLMKLSLHQAREMVVSSGIMANQCCLWTVALWEAYDSPSQRVYTLCLVLTTLPCTEKLCTQCTPALTCMNLLNMHMDVSVWLWISTCKVLRFLLFSLSHTFSDLMCS